MADFWLKLKIWTKITAVGLAIIYVTFFAISNSEEKAKLKYFITETSVVETSVLKLVLVAFLSGVVVTILLRTTYRTIAQIRELKQRQAAEKKEKEFEQLKEKAGMLKTKDSTDAGAA